MYHDGSGRLHWSLKQKSPSRPPNLPIFCVTTCWGLGAATLTGIWGVTGGACSSVRGNKAYRDTCKRISMYNQQHPYI